MANPFALFPTLIAKATKSRTKGTDHLVFLVIDCSYKALWMTGAQEAKSLLRKMMPVARRVLGDVRDLTLRMRWIYAEAPTKLRAPPSTISARP